MSSSDNTLDIRFDPANPGQFFACCGLLELADRLWYGAEGWFDRAGGTFHLRPLNDAPLVPADLLAEIARLRLANEMEPAEIQRRNELAVMKKQSDDPAERERLDREKKKLDTLWREAPILICEPIKMRLDWFLDTRAGGNVFKTWGGQQSVADIAFALHRLLEKVPAAPPSQWLINRINAECLPFNFDCELAAAGSDIDLGFSLDPLRSSKAAIAVLIRPVLEFLAFIGLQRFRPRQSGGELPRSQRRYLYSLWNEPATPELAAFLSSAFPLSTESDTFEFRILYRTDYLKSFLPSTRIRGSSNEQ